jgi:hypothetical protein
MIFAASWAFSTRLHSLSQRFAPSNIVIRQVHTRAGLKWGPLVGVTGVMTYGLLMMAAASMVRGGGPGWGNLIVLVAFWNTVRFVVLIPASLVRLVRVRRQEKILRRDWQRASTAIAPVGDANTPVPVA